MASILCCNWILDDPPVRPVDVTDGEQQQITIAIMAEFQRKTPPEIKVSLLINVDSNTTTPSMAYNQLVSHFSHPDPYLHDKFRSQLEKRAIDKHEKAAKYMKWHRKVRAQMMEAKFPGVEREASTIKWVVCGHAKHQSYNQLASSWRASGPLATLFELEAIFANEEAEVEQAKCMDDQLQSLLKQTKRRPCNAPPNQQQPAPPQNQPPLVQHNHQQQPQKNYRGRGRGRGGRGRGRGQNNNNNYKNEYNENMAQQMQEMAVQRAELQARAPPPNNDDNMQDF